MRGHAMLHLARFVIRNRLRLAVVFGLLTAFVAYPIVNTLFAAAGHRLPGPILHLKSATRSHETRPHRVSPDRAGRKSAQLERTFHV